jgi:NADH dehydrogenase (ubiquinone) 1 alpha subcomplex subunit 5
MLRRAVQLLPSSLSALSTQQSCGILQRSYTNINLSDTATLKKYLGIEEALGVEPEPRTKLTGMLYELISAVQTLPAASDYRRAVEATSQYRLKVLEQNDSDQAVEEVLDAHMEELILETREELALVPLMTSWKPWSVPEDYQVPVVDYIDADTILSAPPPPK